MMLIPRRRNEMDLFEDMFSDPFFTKRENYLMKTDIKELSDAYEVSIDLPGYEKENINLEIEDGYLKVTAKRDETTDESKGKFVHKERFFGECTRDFFVGKNIKEEDIKANFKNGTLVLKFPKEKEKEIEAKKNIPIE